MAHRGGLEMKVEMSRGTGRYIVSQNGEYFLVDLYSNEATKATPPDNPGIFLKAGMWFDAGKLEPEAIAEIKEAMKNQKPHPSTER